MTPSPIQSPLPPWPDIPSGGGADSDYDGELIAALRARLELAVDRLAGEYQYVAGCDCYGCQQERPFFESLSEPSHG